MLGGAMGAAVTKPISSAGYVAAKCIEFAGGNDYVTLGLVPEFEGAPNDGTARCLSFWVKTTNNNYGLFLIGKGDNLSSTFQWAIQLLFGELAVWVGGGISYGATVNDGAWHHIAVSVRSTTTMQFWIDGVSQGTNTAYGALADERSWLVGAIRDSDDTDYTGNIDAKITNLTMWSGGSFDGTKVTELYNSGVPADPNTHSLAANLVGWWKFGDDDTYPTLTDSVNGNNGTMTNMNSGDIVTDAP